MPGCHGLCPHWKSVLATTNNVLFPSLSNFKRSKRLIRRREPFQITCKKSPSLPPPLPFFLHPLCIGILVFLSATHDTHIIMYSQINMVKSAYQVQRGYLMFTISPLPLTQSICKSKRVYSSRQLRHYLTTAYQQRNKCLYR